jgi:D-3-phosphoglycerate dehydrogenase
VAQFQLFAANYNESAMWVYDKLRRWLADRDTELVLRQCATEDEVIRQAQGADMYLAYKFPISRKIVAALPRLKLLMSSGIGYDHIDVPAATDYGIVVTNAATHCVEDVAEHTLSLILACARKLCYLDSAAQRGEWRPDVHPVFRFGNQTVGLVGFGNIARALAWRARALGFRVMAYSRSVPADEIRQQAVQPVGLEDLLRESDFVSLHWVLDEDTHHSFGERQFRLMKPTAYLINTSRGGLVDEAALINALQASWIAGAGLDVLEQEPPRRDNPLLKMSNVMVSAHSAAHTVEAPHDWLGEWQTIIEAFLAGVWPINVVNPDVEPKVSLKKKAPS